MGIEKYAVLKCEFCTHRDTCQKRFGMEKVAGSINVSDIDNCGDFAESEELKNGTSDIRR